jgi:hypothetical protein
MTAFEFAFTLFGLVLGLAMAEVLAGFVRVLKARTAAPEQSATIRIGWLTPAIGLLVTLDLVSTWMVAWTAREAIPISFLTLILGTAATALYFVAASLVWPDDPERWPDLDAWFERHKGQIGGAIAAANAGSMVDLLVHPGSLPVLQFAYIALALALIGTRRRWQSGLAIAAMLAIIALFAVGVVV